MEKSGTKARKALGVLAMLLLVPASGWSQGPPQQAFDAYAGKKAGDEVRFATPRGDTVDAVCREFDGKLAAAPERGRGGWHGRGPGRHFERIADDLDLTAEQEKQARSILDAERDKSEALRKQLRDGREQIRDVAGKSPLDEAAIRKLAAAQEKTRADLIVSRAQAANKVYALLTPEQKERAGKRGLFGGGPGKGFGMGRGGGSGPVCDDCRRR